jgi:putative N6-adenine-specific DNA methylase
MSKRDYRTYSSNSSEGDTEKQRPEQKPVLSAHALERRLKRYLLKENQRFLAITTPGFETILEKEIAELGSTQISGLIEGGVEYSGDIDLIYNSNLYLRTANRILMRIGEFTARSYPELYNKCKRIRWELFTGFNSEVSFSVSSRKSRLHHTDNIASTVYDAISESIRPLGLKVKLNKDALLRFHIRFSDDICIVSVDTSGELLYKRTKQKKIGDAPIRESLAAALLITSGWEKYGIIIDPLCGSGTFIIEAALMQLKRAPGLEREFAFSILPWFNLQKWNRLKNQAVSNVKNEMSIQLIGSDIDQSVLLAASSNAAELGLSKKITFVNRDCLELDCSKYNKKGLIISNLPYGKRIGNESGIRNLIDKLGKHLLEKCLEWEFAFVVAEENFQRISGLKVKNKIKFRNGGLSVQFVMGKISVK